MVSNNFMSPCWPVYTWPLLAHGCMNNGVKDVISKEAKIYCPFNCLFFSASKQSSQITKVKSNSVVKQGKVIYWIKNFSKKINPLVDPLHVSPLHTSIFLNPSKYGWAN